MMGFKIIFLIIHFRHRTLPEKQHKTTPAGYVLSNASKIFLMYLIPSISKPNSLQLSKYYQHYCCIHLSRIPDSRGWRSHTWSIYSTEDISCRVWTVTGSRVRIFYVRYHPGYKSKIPATGRFLRIRWHIVHSVEIQRDRAPRYEISY